MEKIDESKKKDFYKIELSGLRAFGVITATIYNFNKNLLPSGFLGVDIFFVISGYAITASLCSGNFKFFKDFIFDFYFRRIRRIFPSLVVFVILISFLICLVSNNPTVFLKTGFTSLLGLSNFYLMRISSDYFSPSAELNPFTQTWSLSMQLQFYLIYPLIFWCSGISKSDKLREKRLVFNLILLLVASYITFSYLHLINPTIAYYLMPARLWQIVSGCLLFILIKNKYRFVQVLKSIPSYLPLILIIATFFLPAGSEYLSTSLITIFTTLLICSIKKEDFSYKLFTSKVMLHISKLSYPLFLYRWAVVSLSLWTIGLHLWSVPLQILFLYLISLLSYNLVEKPAFSISKFLAKEYFVKISVCIVLIISSVILLLDKFFSSYLYISNYKNSNLLTQGMGDYKFKGINDKDYLKFSKKNCHFSAYSNIEDFANGINCKLIKKDNSPTIYLVGSSVANSLRKSIFLIHKKYDFSIDGITLGTCSFPKNIYQKSCGNLQEWQLSRILKNTKEGDIVINASLYKKRNYHLFDKKEYINSLKKFTDKLSKKGVTYIQIAPLPEFTIPIEACIQSWFKPSFSLSEECFKKADSLEYLDQINKIEKISSKNFLIYEPNKSLCLNSDCSFFDKESKPLYADTFHLSDYANEKYIFSDFSKFLKNNGLIK